MDNPVLFGVQCLYARSAEKFESLMTTPVRETPTVSPQAKAVALPTEGYRELFQNKTFVALWVGQIFSQLADRIIFVVFITLIVTHFGAQGSLKSFLYIAFTIPAVLLTAVAGVFVDRWHRRRTLVATNLLRAIIVAAIPLAIHAQSLIALYACAFGISTVTQFFVPAESATIPMITRSSQLLVANSLFTTTMMGSVIFGFALGDPLIQLFGLREVHWAIVGLFLLSSVSLAFVQAGYPSSKIKASSEPRIGTAVQRFWNEMKEGIDYLRHEKLILHKILKLAVLFSYVVAMCIVFISFAETYLYVDPKIAAQKFAWIITFSGIGMVVGALGIGRCFRNVAGGKLVYTGFTVIGLGLIAMVFTQFLSNHSIFPVLFPYLDWRVLYSHILAIFLGAGAAMVAVPLQSVLHELIPEDKRGKIMGVQFTLLSACSTFPVVLAGVGVDIFGVAPMLVILGIPLLILGGRGLYDRIKHGNGDYASTW
jgi:MFS family permease